MELETKISTLTTIPEKSLRHVHRFLNLVHSNDIVTQIIKHNAEHSDDPVEIDLFEGKLYISIIDDNIRYKFIPNDEFNELVRDSYINKRSKLVEEASVSLKRTLSNTYNDII